METLGDTGCSQSCISEAFLRRHIKLYKRYFRPFVGSARSIDGSKVVTVGIINICFRLGLQYRTINCRVVRNLIHDFVLGWDFFNRYDAQLHAKEGYLACEGEKINLIPNSSSLGGAQYAVHEEIVIPPFSKAHFAAALKVGAADLSNATNVVCLEPAKLDDFDVCTARSISRVEGGMVMVEAINPGENSIRLPEGTVLGFAEFYSEEELEKSSEYAGMDLHYNGYDSAYESMDESESEAVSEDEAEELTAAAASAAVGKAKTQVETKHSPQPDAPDPVTGSDPAAGEKSWKVDLSKLAPEAKDREEDFRHLFEVKHADVIAKHERDYGRTTLTQHHARLIDKTPIATPPFRHAPEMQGVIDKQVNEMLADGLLSHSTSPYSAPILLVRKKEPGKWRFVTDFRRVNAATQKVIYPLPRIEDCLHRLKNPKFFTSLDLVKGFWQVPVAEEDRHIYAFSTGSAHVEYNVMPMGAKNSTSTLQALMQLLMRGLPAEHVVCFLDDILVASATVEEHLVHLDKVLTALGRANLKLHPRKCAVARESAVCLGHLLDREGIRPDPHNLAKVVKWPVPKDVKEVRGFLGLTGYYRQFIRDYSKVAEPLTNLTSKEKDWTWGSVEQKAFETLRDALTSSPIVAYPDFDKPFWLKTDASAGSVGYVLSQFHDGKERVISYGSKKLDKAQRNYSTYDRELFGLLTGIRSNSHYLRLQPFFAVTDHRPLLAWRKKDLQKDVTGRRARWGDEIEGYDFQLIYKEGNKHSDADALSRRPNEDEDCVSDDEDFAALSEEVDLFRLGQEDEDCESAVKYTCHSSYLRKLREEQDTDPNIISAKGYVKQRRRPPRGGRAGGKLAWYRKNFANLIVKKGVLYLKRLEPLTDAMTLRAVIPQSLVPDVLKDAHGSMLSGHPGVARMSARLVRHVAWDNMGADIRRHVEQCKQCDLIKQHNPPVRTPLQPIKARKVNDHIICDLLALPKAPGNFNYVLVCMDVFSKFVNLYKLRNKEAAGVATCIQDLFFSRGFPRKLGSDNGTEFDNHILNSVTKLLGVEKATSVVYRPQSQGMVERHNKQIISELQKRLAQFGNNWPEHLPFVQYAYNSTPHSKTGEAPFKVVFGTEPPLPSFEEVDIDHHKDKTVRKYVEDLQKRLQTIREAVKERTLKKVEQEEAIYNKKEKHAPLEIGDKVYEKENVRSSKLSPKWKAEIVKVVERCKTAEGKPGFTYMVERPDGSRHRRNLEQLRIVKALPPEEESRKVEKQGGATAMLWDSDEEGSVNLKGTLPGFRPLPATSLKGTVPLGAPPPVGGKGPTMAVPITLTPPPTIPTPPTSQIVPIITITSDPSNSATITPTSDIPQITTLNIGHLANAIPQITTLHIGHLANPTPSVTPTTQSGPSATNETPTVSTPSSMADTPITVVRVSSRTGTPPASEVRSISTPPSLEPATLPPVPPGQRRRRASYAGESPATNRRSLASPRAVRSSSVGTPVKLGEIKGKSGGKLKAKNRLRAPTSSERSGIQSNPTGTSIRNFTQFLRHSSTEGPEADIQQEDGGNAVSSSNTTTVDSADRPVPIMRLTDEILARQLQKAPCPPPHPLIARFQAGMAALDQPLQGIDQPLHPAGNNRHNESESDSNSQGFATAEEESSSEDNWQETHSGNPADPVGGRRQAKGVRRLNVGEQTVRPRYNLRNRDNLYSPQSEAQKRGIDSTEPQGDSAQSPKHLLQDKQILQDTPKLNFTRIAFIPQRAENPSGEPSYRAIAYRTAEDQLPGSEMENPFGPRASNQSNMDLDDVFE